jgi:glyceraldehyde-3-phosphate dehydrogenase/erythrose-4-phosphate dehydrogenase
MRIGINGFGRIGRNFTKALWSAIRTIEIAAVNDLTDAAECAHLFKYDSNYGTYAGERERRRRNDLDRRAHIRVSPSAIRASCRGATWASTS